VVRERSGKGQGKTFFFGKVRENEKLVPPDVYQMEG